jgi:hypothetical protein
MSLYGKADGAGADADEELRLLVERARRGEHDVLPRLRALLDGRPDVWRHAGDLGRHAEAAWVDLVCGADLFLKESIHRRLAELKAGLFGASTPTALEELLVQRVVVCWVEAHHADISLAQAKDSSLKQSAALTQLQDRAQHRLLAAVAALTSARRLLPRATAGAGVNPGAAGTSPTATAGRPAGGAQEATHGCDESALPEGASVPFPAGGKRRGRSKTGGTIFTGKSPEKSGFPDNGGGYVEAMECQGG